MINPSPSVRHDLAVPRVEPAVAVAALLADRCRAVILAMLAQGPCCVTELVIALDARENNVSAHLAKLRRAGLVRAERCPTNGRLWYYSRDEAAITRAEAEITGLLHPRPLQGAPA